MNYTDKIYDRFTQEEMYEGRTLGEVLELHEKWLEGDPDGIRADLIRADLKEADLRWADLSGADLSNVDLRRARLIRANLDGVRLPDYQICPEEGSFIAWKKLGHNHIAKIEVPAEAKRISCLIDRKCRAEYVKTISIYDPEGNPVYKEVPGMFYVDITYKAGGLTYPDKYCDDIRIDCSHGIHFFMTRREAKQWMT